MFPWSFPFPWSMIPLRMWQSQPPAHTLPGRPSLFLCEGTESLQFPSSRNPSKLKGKSSHKKSVVQLSVVCKLTLTVSLKCLASHSAQPLHGGTRCTRRGSLSGLGQVLHCTSHTQDQFACPTNLPAKPGWMVSHQTGLGGICWELWEAFPANYS